MNAQLSISENMPQQSPSWRLLRAVDGKKFATPESSSGGTILEMPGRARTGWRDPAELSRKINVPWHFASPELQERAELISEFEALVKNGSWGDLLGRLRGLDQRRVSTESGTRLYEAALLGARGCVTRNLTDSSRMETALKGLETLKLINIAHKEDYVAAVILARALIDIAWAERGGETGKASPQGLAAFRARFAEAEEVLEGFEPVEENSPMLAEARYLLAPGIDGGLKFLRDWYDDWADLDPTNPATLSTHSRYIMPQWYGSFEEIEREARRAVTRAKGMFGASAYAWFWLTPLSRDDALNWVDADLFIEGVHQILSRSNDQRLANLFAAKLYRLGHRSRGRVKPAAKRALKTRARLAKAFEDVVRTHMREVHTMHWATDDIGVRIAIARVFEKDIIKGAFIRAGNNGLEVKHVSAA